MSDSSDAESYVAPKTHANKSRRELISKIRRAAWTESNKQGNDNRSFDDSVFVFNSSAMCFCPGCLEVKKTNDHCDGKCIVCVATSRLNFAYELFCNEESLPKISVDEWIVSYVAKKYAIDLEGICLADHEYRPDHVVGDDAGNAKSSAISFHECYMQLDADHKRKSKGVWEKNKLDLKRNIKKDEWYYSGWKQHEREMKG